MSFSGKLLRSTWKLNRIERAVRNPGPVCEAEGKVEVDEQGRLLAGFEPLVAGVVRG